MPEPPDEFEREVREELDEMAGEAAPSPTPPPGVLRSARHRVARNSAALVVALAMVTGGIVAGIQLVGRDGSGPIPIATTEPPTSGVPTCDLSHQQGSPCPGGTTAPETTSPTTAATSPPSATSSPSGSGPPGGTGTGPLPATLFVDGVIYRYLNGTKGLAAVRVGSIPEETAAQPPVVTTFGIVVLGGDGGPGSNLWQVSEGANRQLLATNVSGFGVSASGTQVAYSVADEGGRRTELVAFSNIVGQVRLRTTVDTFARVIGYAEDRVVLETGDGAGAAVALWRPGDDGVDYLNRYGSAVATDPVNGHAVLNEGDGTCWRLVRIMASGQVGRTDVGECSPLVGVSFEPGGATIAGVEIRSPDRTGRQIVIVQGVGTQLGGALDLPGLFQTWWDGRGRYLVIAENKPGHLDIQQCQVSENMCPAPPVWTGTTAGGEGTAWIVEERPAA
jgi:hypothetical protein